MNQLFLKVRSLLLRGMILNNNTNDMESMKVLKKALDENLNKGWIKNNVIITDLPFDYDISITNVAGLFQLDTHYQGKHSSYKGMSNFHFQKHTSIEDGKEV